MLCKAYDTGIVLIGVTAVSAQNRPVPDLKNVSAGQEAADVRDCREEYEVALRDGSRRTFKDYDLALKTDWVPRLSLGRCRSVKASRILATECGTPD